MMRGRGERGYGMIIAAMAVLFLAVAASTIIPIAAGGTMSARLEVDQTCASAVASSGLEWSLANGLSTGTRTLGRGTFTVARSGRRIESTGTYGEATRKAVCELTLFYVPQSRYGGVDDRLIFEVYNKTGADVALTGLTAKFSAEAYYERVELNVFAEISGPPAISYGTVFTAGASRPGSGTAISFDETATIPVNRQALVQLLGFRSRANGGSALDMDAVEGSIAFRDAAGPLAAVGVPRVQP